MRVVTASLISFGGAAASQPSKAMVKPWEPFSSGHQFLFFFFKPKSLLGERLLLFAFIFNLEIYVKYIPPFSIHLIRGDLLLALQPLVLFLHNNFLFKKTTTWTILSHADLM